MQDAKKKQLIMHEDLYSHDSQYNVNGILLCYHLKNLNDKTLCTIYTNFSSSRYFKPLSK